MRIEDQVNYTDYSFIKDIKLLNESDVRYNDLKIQIEFSNPIFKMNDIEICYCCCCSVTK